LERTNKLRETDRQTHTHTHTHSFIHLLMSHKKQDNSGFFRDFITLCEDIAGETKHTQKTQIVQNFLKNFEGDWYLLLKLLLPKQDHRVFQLKDKALIKVMSQVLGTDHEMMLKHLEKGDASETCKKFLMESGFESKTSFITLQQVDVFLDKLTLVRKQAEQVEVFENFVLNKLTGKDIKYIARLIDKDLRIYAGIRYLLPALHPNAYDAFILTNNLKDIVEKVVNGDDLQNLTQSQSLSSSFDLEKILHEGSEDEDMNDIKLEDDNNSRTDDSDNIDQPVNPEDDEDELELGSKKRKKKLQSGNEPKKAKLIPKITLFQPIKPMLARASKSFDDSIARCPNGFYMELKYDGERIQIHYDRSKKKLSCFSRNLKPVMEYKVKEVEPYISQSIKQSVQKVILDGEILLIDTKTGQPLPFGTLGKHKKDHYANANVSVFMFDILYYEGKSLLEVPINQRRRLLLKTVKPIKDRILIGESIVCNGSKTDREAMLAAKMQAVIKAGQEGLVLKDLLSIYEPNARHWLKIKKDYLKGMADSADLLVLGAYFGTGSKGGLLSVFLMGVYDEKEKNYKTVCKCGNGHDDETINQLNKDLKKNMIKISGNYHNIPNWLDIDRSLVPDFIINDPNNASVWEIAGAEFSFTKKHTAKISIRFPRVTRIRDDKDPNQATTLQQLIKLAKASSKKDPVVLEESIKIPNTSTSRFKKVSTSSDSDNQDTESESGEEICEPANLDYIWGDISNLIGSGNKIIAHSVDDSGRWSTKGTMGLISTKYGKDAENVYKMSDDITMGSIHTAEILQPNDSTDKLYVCSMVAQQFIKKGKPPVIDYKQLEVCLHRLRLFIKKEERAIGCLTVHFSRLHHSIPNLNWTKCEQLLKEILTAKGIPVVVYTKDKDDKTLLELSKKKDKSSSTSFVQTERTVPTKGIEIPEDKKESTESFKGLFHSVFAVISGYDDSTTENLKELIGANGGKVQTEWVMFGKSKSTHLITESQNTTFQHVSNLDAIIVSKQWIFDSIQAGTALNVAKYLFNPFQEKEYSKDRNTSTLSGTKSTSELAKSSSISALSALPDVFSNCCVYLLGEVKKRRLVKRYLIAYNADVLEEFDDSLTTHVVTDSAVSTSALQNFSKSNVHVVKSSWVWQSVNNETKANEKDHSI
jgi:DNA ligase-3